LADKTNRREKCFWGGALNFAGKTTPPKNLPILLHDCEQDATTKKTHANEINLAITPANVQKMLTGKTN